MAIEVVGVDKSFKAGKPVLKNIGLRIARGEMVALIGASGSGKSTLIRAIAGLVDVDRARAGAEDKPASSIRILGQAMQENGRISGAASSLRAHMGVIFQQFNLVPRLSVLTNVCLGLLGQIPAWRGSLALFTRAEQQRAMHGLTPAFLSELYGAESEELFLPGITASAGEERANGHIQAPERQSTWAGPEGLAVRA